MTEFNNVTCACELVRDSSHGGATNYTIMDPFWEIWYWPAFSDSKKAVGRAWDMMD